ncbi:MAG: hypothetical protein GY719_06235 [bacterium]|nr:hypothetical protein [bacterium]
MKITAVKSWYPLDENRAFDVGRDHLADFEEAIRAEYGCESSCCDICHALEAGFVLVAADLLTSAIEAPLLAALEQAHRFNGTANLASSEDEWPKWHEYWSEAEKEGRLWKCAHCEVFNWGSNYCGACLAPRPVWKLTHAAYCGMARVLASDPDPEVVRAQAAFEIRYARRKGFDIAVRRCGAEWEILESEGCALVPGESGVLTLELTA